jgi:hypothetical protein
MADTSPKRSSDTPQVYRLHWRSLRGPEAAPTSVVYADREEARAVVGYMNTAQDGLFHWHFVAELVSILAPGWSNDNPD